MPWHPEADLKTVLRIRWYSSDCGGVDARDGSSLQTRAKATAAEAATVIHRHLRTAQDSAAAEVRAAARVELRAEAVHGVHRGRARVSVREAEKVIASARKPGVEDSHSYSSGKSYSGSSGSKYSSGSGSRTDTSVSKASKSSGSSSGFNFDTAAARARKEETSKSDYTKFKDSQNPSRVQRDDSYRGGAPPVTTPSSRSYRRNVYVPDTVVIHAAIADLGCVSTVLASAPGWTDDPYSSLFWWWLLDRTSMTRPGGRTIIATTWTPPAMRRSWRTINNLRPAWRNSRPSSNSSPRPTYTPNRIEIAT